MSISNRWILDFAKNRSSQAGEDGIIEKILHTIGETSEWCVEFGAWDGRYYSNTFDLINRKGYSAIMIEGDVDRYQDLLETFKDNTKVIPLNAFVGFSEVDGLDSLLEKTSIPLDFDVLSIDIDGNDYHVWKEVKQYRPKVVCIEYNPTIPSEVEFVQPADMQLNQGCSILSLYQLAEEKGYKLVSVTNLNCLFVDAKYFDLFSIKDNTVTALRPNESKVTYIFNGYDGTVFVRGHGKLGWHHLPYDEKRLQQIPAWLRQFPDSYGPIKRIVARWYRTLRKRRIL